MRANHKSIVINGVSISNPDKVMFEVSGITKKDVARYYAKVSERMMPFVGNRILSILRCPDGISGECFFQKHPLSSGKGIIKMPIRENDGETVDYFYIKDENGLISEVQMGTLEFHTMMLPDLFILVDMGLVPVEFPFRIKIRIKILLPLKTLGVAT